VERYQLLLGRQTWRVVMRRSPEKQTLRAFIKRLVDYFIVPPVRYIRVKSGVVPVPTDVLSTMRNNAILDSANYAELHMASGIAFAYKETLWAHVIGLCGPEGLYAEFGVWKGESINFFARLLKGCTLYGFDSFEGLKDDWPGFGVTRGHFSLDGALPVVEPNVELIKGLFHETLPAFLEAHDGMFSFLHIDCDTYDSTRTLFTLLRSRLQVGTIILFDEYFGYRGWRHEEWKAWQEFVAANQIKYEYKAFSNQQVAVQIVEMSLPSLT
jgi:Methyltransferase domain